MPINVMIVDDSGAVRHAVEQLLEGEEDIVVQASVPDPYAAAKEIKNKVPDVLILDLEMPKMDGITFLKRIMSQRPIATIICSTLTAEGSPKFLEGLRAGAVEVLEKPKISTKKAYAESQLDLIEKIRIAAASNIGEKKKTSEITRTKTKKPGASDLASVPKHKPDVLLPLQRFRENGAQEPLVVIGASTGGTVALEMVLTDLPVTVPGIVVVQHMPEHFTRAFAKRLDTVCKLRVKEAEDRDRILPGTVYIAPGNIHAAVRRIGPKYQIALIDGPPITRHKPSVDILFRSAAGAAGPNALGIILTGMGDDGAIGMKEMRDQGAQTLAQDEKSCVVYGMPREALLNGGAEKAVPLNKIPNEILNFQPQSRSRECTYSA